MRIIQAKNVEDAVQLASEMKARNEYNWFRGQVSLKPPTSSLQRRVAKDKSFDTREVWQRFSNWLNKTPSLADLQKVENVNKLFAILQHYGVPTCYIDFTTEPCIAGFFASDCNVSPETNHQSVIYCLNTDELISFYKEINKVEGMKNYLMELVSVDVENLWRLQAQHGHFLYVNHDWTKLYSMDRIVFPWTGLPSFPSKEEIYPEHKSDLEQLLDQYFFCEQSYQSMENLKKIVDDKGKKIMHFVLADELANGYEADLFDKPLDELSSWQDSKIASWNMRVAENFHQIIGKKKRVYLRNDINAASLSDQIFLGLQNALSLDKELRSYAIDWEFKGLQEEFPIDRYCNLVKQAWNGMRRLPFSNKDIANTFRELFNLCLIPNCDSFNGHLVDSAFNQWRTDAFEIEIANFNQARSRSYCSEKSLLNLIDNEWMNSLKDKDENTSLTRALQITNKPSLIFDFDGLVNIFCIEIIPAQLARGRELILYNPAHLVTLGLP